MAHKPLTISEFSHRTGLSASALRFYESKSLLVPDRLPNGYRVYEETQIETARLVHSLREAGIAIQDIRRFLSASPELRKEWLETWRQKAEARVLQLQISMQFLNGVSPNMERVHLIHWDRPTRMIWKRVVLPQPPSSFRPLLDDHRDSLTRMGAKAGPDGYIRTLSVTDDFVVELGFVVAQGKNHLPSVESLAEDHHVETLPPTLFVTVRCAADDPYVCMQITRFVAQFGYVPVGSRLDKYPPNEDTVEVMIPVRRETEFRYRPY